jgi:ABC-type amino acid transport system permease subunit
LILASPTYTGKEREIYGFLLVVYFAIGSVLTFASRRLERRAGPNLTTVAAGNGQIE